MRKVKFKLKYWFYLGLIVKDNIFKYGVGLFSVVCRDENSLLFR